MKSLDRAKCKNLIIDAFYLKKEVVEDQSTRWWWRELEKENVQVNWNWKSVGGELLVQHRLCTCIILCSSFRVMKHAFSDFEFALSI